jgi:hypothetical protein
MVVRPQAFEVCPPPYHRTTHPGVVRDQYRDAFGIPHTCSVNKSAVRIGNEKVAEATRGTRHTLAQRRAWKPDAVEVRI